MICNSLSLAVVNITRNVVSILNCKREEKKSYFWWWSQLR